MAPTAKKAPAKKAAPKPPPVETEELEDDDDLEELEEDEVEETAPAKKATKAAAANAVTFGVSDLAAYLVKKTGVKVDARGLRTLIRKMARDDSGRVEREIIAGNRTRYDWQKGLKDPEVIAIIKAFEGGELEADKQEKLQALKDRKAAQGTTAKPGQKAKKKAKPAPVVEELDDEDEDLEDDEDE